MSWGEDYDDEEIEREFERARQQDRARTGSAAGLGAVLPSEIISGVARQVRCASCGHEGGTLLLDPLQGGRLVCVSRTDETRTRIDCYDRLDRELARRHGEMVEQKRKVIQAAKASNVLSDEDKRYLLGTPDGKTTVDALEARFARERDSKPTTARGHKP